jgi:hypothetical protein
MSGTLSSDEITVLTMNFLNVCLQLWHDMPVGGAMRATHYVRKSYFVDEKAVKRARKALGVNTDAEAVRLSVERTIEMEVFWRFMAESRKGLKPGSIEAS